MSSFSASLSASAIVCSRPNGPARLGPARFCMRPMIRRSAQIVMIVPSTRNTKTATALRTITHHG
jgi:hypothetical protein